MPSALRYDATSAHVPMFTARGWSYSSEARPRATRGAYRVRRGRGGSLRLVAVLVPLVVTLAVGALATAAPGTQRTLDPSPTPLNAALMPLQEAPPTAVAPVLALGTSAPTLRATSPPTAVPTTVPPTLVPTPLAPIAQTFAPLLPGHRIVAYYGNPLAKEMGILGELPSDQMLRKLQQQIAQYAAADPARPVVPALELVTPAAQGWPGEDGLYRARMKPEVIDEVASWAETNHALLILDVQIGLSTVPDEVNALVPYLRRPYVHLALDPEFAIPSGHVPGEVVGTLDAAAIDGAIHTLSSLVVAEHLPPKILIVHRFTDSMVTNAWAIAHDPHVQVVMTMDGFGPPGLKLAQYHAYVHDDAVQHAGIKLFYHHDVPLLGPREVLGLDPLPDVVIYQ